MLWLVGSNATHEGLSPEGDWLERVRVFASELKRYDAMKVEYPPAMIVKLTIASKEMNVGYPQSSIQEQR